MSKTRVLAEDASEDVRQTQKEVEFLRQEMDKLTLTTMALWEIVRERFDISDQELMLKIHEIDKRDGKVDGKIPQEPVNCPDCGRPVSIKTNTCLYCDIKVFRSTPF